MKKNITSTCKRAGYGYLLLVHALLAVVLWKSDFVNKVEVMLGLQSPTMSFYQKMTLIHKTMDGSIPEGAILFIGDSITQAMVTSSVSDLSVNLGIYSDTTAGALRRLPLYESVERARAVVLSIGINDIHQGIDQNQTLANYRDILDHIPATVSVQAWSVLPIGSAAEKPGFGNREISDLNTEIRSVVTDYENVTFLDSHAELQNEAGQLPDEYHVGDGVHLSTEGYRVLTQQLSSALSALHKDFQLAL